MASEDYYDDEEEEVGADEAEAPDGDGVDDSELAGRRRSADFRSWLNAKRGWLLVAGLAAAQGFFWLIMLQLGSRAKPVAEAQQEHIRAFAVDMLGHEVAVNQIYQLVPMRGGRKMTVGLDLVLVLGQLPEERIEGMDRPTAEEMQLFIDAVQAMEPSIRSQVNILLQRVPADAYGGVGIHKTIKEEIRKEVNDRLENLDFGKALRPGISKRRVTEVLLPMFVRQQM